MPATLPDYSINYFVPLSASGSASVGQLMIPNSTDGTNYVLATSSNRGTRRCEGIAISSWTGAPGNVGSIRILQSGVVAPTISGLGAGTASWVRCSATGVPERFAPTLGGSSDVIGRCETDGRLHLMCGVFDETIAVGSGAGGATLSGTNHGVLSLSGTNGVGDAFWTMATAGRLDASYQFNSSNQGGITFRGAGDASNVPNIGTFRYSDQLADNGGVGSITIVGYYRSSGAANVQQGVVGLSGGGLFLGDPSNPLTPVTIYGTSGTPATFAMGAGGDIFFTGTHYSSLGGATKVLGIDNTGKLSVVDGSGFFTPGGDLSGTSSSQTVVGISGSSPIPITPANLRWVIGATTPKLSQVDQTAGSTNGQALTVQAQNATGGTSTGGALNLTSGTGTTAAGQVNLNIGSITGLSLLASGTFQFGGSVGAPIINQVTNATNSATGNTLVVQAQNCSGTTSNGGPLTLTSGTGTTAAGNVLLQTGGTTKLTIAPTLLTSVNPIAIGSTVASTGDIRHANATGVYARNAANNADLPVWQTDSGNFIYAGVDAGFATFCNTYRISASSEIIIGVSTTRHLELTTTQITVGKPVVGNTLASSPWSGCNGTGTQAMADANQTAASSVYQNTAIVTTGAITANRTLTVPSATDAQAYPKWINNTCTGAFGIVVSTGAGTTITVANGKSAWVWIDSRGVTRMTADV